MGFGMLLNKSIAANLSTGEAGCADYANEKTGKKRLGSYGDPSRPASKNLPARTAARIRHASRGSPAPSPATRPTPTCPGAARGCGRSLPRATRRWRPRAPAIGGSGDRLPATVLNRSNRDLAPLRGHLDDRQRMGWKADNALVERKVLSFGHDPVRAFNVVVCLGGIAGEDRRVELAVE